MGRVLTPSVPLTGHGDSGGLGYNYTGQVDGIVWVGGLPSESKSFCTDDTMTLQRETDMPSRVLRR